MYENSLNAIKYKIKVSFFNVFKLIDEISSALDKVDIFNVSANLNEGVVIVNHTWVSTDDLMFQKELNFIPNMKILYGQELHFGSEENDLGYYRMGTYSGDLNIYGNY